MTPSAPVSAGWSSSSARISPRPSNKAIGARFADRIEVDYVFQKLDDLPEGFSVPEGRRNRGAPPTPCAPRAMRSNEPLRRDQCRRFLRPAMPISAPPRFSAACPQGTTNEMAMVGYPLENTLSDHGHVNRGICQIDEEGFLTNVEEYLNIERESDGHVRGNALDGKRHVVPAGSLVSMNFWAFGPAFFAQLEEAFTRFLNGVRQPDEIRVLHPDGGGSVHPRRPRPAARCCAPSSPWFGVTYPEDKPYVVESIRKLIALRVYPDCSTNRTGAFHPPPAKPLGKP